MQPTAIPKRMHTGRHRERGRERNETRSFPLFTLKMEIQTSIHKLQCTIAICWAIRGQNQVLKHRQISEHIVSYSLDLIEILLIPNWNAQFWPANDFRLFDWLRLFTFSANNTEYAIIYWQAAHRIDFIHWELYIFFYHLIAFHHCLGDFIISK